MSNSINLKNDDHDFFSRKSMKLHKKTTSVKKMLWYKHGHCLQKENWKSSTLSPLFSYIQHIFMGNTYE